MGEIGKAYGFFDCKASKGVVEEELRKVRNGLQIPSDVQIYLDEGIDRLRDTDLAPVLRRVERTGLRYALEAAYPEATNERAAGVLADILNQAHAPPLFEEGEPLRGEVVYRSKGRYVNWE